MMTDRVPFRDEGLAAGAIEKTIRNPSQHSSSARNGTADLGHRDSIELKLRDLNQLFNSMAPSPFIEKDLDDDAEEFIVGWADIPL